MKVIVAHPEDVRTIMAADLVPLDTCKRLQSDPNSVLERYVLEPWGEVERLRALVKAAEWEGAAEWMHSACPWCQADSRGKHNQTCPAFTPEGDVR